MAKTTIKTGSSFEEKIWIIYLWLPISYVWYYFLVDLKEILFDKVSQKKLGRITRETIDLPQVRLPES